MGKQRTRAPRGADQAHLTPAKRLLYWLITLVVMAGLAELTAFAALALHARVNGVSYQPLDDPALLTDDFRVRIAEMMEGRRAYVMHNPTLGWTLKPSSEAPPLYRANSQGLRADADYALDRPPGVIRIAAFGDSYTHCDGVANAETWQARMEAARPGIEVLNFGVFAYGIDQAYLRFQEEGAQFRPDIVLIGYMPENICRSVNTFRPFYTPHGPPYPKPRFTLDDGALHLVSQPYPQASGYADLLDDPVRALRRLGRHDFYYQIGCVSGPFDWSPTVRAVKLIRAGWRTRRLGPFMADGTYNTASEAYRVTLALIEAFARDVREAGAEPVVTILPSRDDLYRLRAGAPRMYAPLLEDLHARDLPAIDLLDAFEEIDDLDALFLDHNHYTPRANAVVADAILHGLEGLGLLAGSSAAR